MRHYEPQRKAMIRRQRPAIMVRGQQDVVTIEISQRDIGRESLLGMYQNIFGFRFGHYQLQKFPERDTFPLVVKAAPAGDAMEITGVFGARQLVEFVPGKLQWVLDQAPHPEVPLSGVEARNRAVMQHRPFQRERLAGWKAAFAEHLLLFLFAFVVTEHRLIVYRLALPLSILRGKDRAREQRDLDVSVL